MLIDSVVINLSHTGAGFGPVYNITIHGYGKIIYEGFENVKVKGSKEIVIDEKYIVIILNELKRSNFFSLNENYSSDDLEHRQCTTISVSIPKNENEFIKKSITFCQGDREVPKELKILVGKIEEIVDSERWVGKYENFIQKKEVPAYKKETPIEEKISSVKVKKRPYRLIGIVIVFLVVISLIIFSVYSGFLNLFSENNDNQDKLILGKNLEIISVGTAKFNAVNLETGEYTLCNNFKTNETIWVIQKYTNISTINNEICNLSLSIIVTNNDTLYHTDIENNRPLIGKSIQAWYFSLMDWPVGEYLVKVDLKDNIANTTAVSKTTQFYIS